MRRLTITVSLALGLIASLVLAAEPSSDTTVDPGAATVAVDAGCPGGFDRLVSRAADRL